MNKKAGLEFSVKSIMSFILAIIIFGFGIFLLFSVFDKANVISVPDFCTSTLKSDIQNNEVFSICPKTINLDKKSLYSGFKVSFVFVNLQDNDVFVKIFLDDDSDFDIVSLPIKVVSGEYSSSDFLLRLKETSVFKNEYVLKVKLCKVDNLDDDSDSCNNILEEKVLIVNVE